MTYAVKEIYFTLQGEGAQSGRPAVFCRFAGCNLWSGREADRADAICRFCDTEFVGTSGPGGGRFADASALAEAIVNAHPDPTQRPFVVLTGGEPLLQVDEPLLDRLHEAGFEVAVETNGTLPLPRGLDWVCMSPKANTELVVRSGSELKLVFPQEGARPEAFEELEFDHFYLQPMDGPNRAENTRAAVEYCLAHPRWKLSIQTHKLIGIP
ncbi:MAG: 7-carboxy-7-deazaguanine synthase [Candidatus Eisenbacteria bacterium]|uniref:7-carboxy-7-deazaguanine synthase n=1 Tax=Eiseniibacteriota bacterium TaxID=2212470 RepID=A0A956NJR9_UNCEI|nr:7-carboxy-7-deazaguanine synthase [Candidatus Eisenbacteria bacterium]